MVRAVSFKLQARPPLPSRKARRLRLTISGGMSANAVLKQYPQTAALFDQLHIDRQREGYESVEELVWRRGVDEQRFLGQLRQVAKVFPGSRYVG